MAETPSQNIYVEPPAGATYNAPQPAAVVPPPPSGGILKKFLLIILAILILMGVIATVFKFFPKAKPSGQATINYWGLWEADEIVAPIIADYERTHPNVKINYSRQDKRQYRERLASSLSRGEGPDIFRFHNTWVPMFSQDLAPMPENIANQLDLGKNFYPIVTADLKKGGQYYGIPLMIDGLGLFVNEQIFRSGGMAYPITWDELKEAACKLTAIGEDDRIRTAGVALGTASNVEHWSDILGLMMLQNGVKLTNPTGKLAEDALIYYVLFTQEEACTPAHRVWDDTQDNSILAFAQGKVAMILAPSWEAHEINYINPQLSFKILTAPQLPGDNISWASYWVEGVWQKSKNKEAAFEFLQYLASKEVMTKFYTEASKKRLFGEPYSRIDLGQQVASDPYVGAYIAQAPNAKSFYMCSRTYDNGINDKTIKYFEDAVNSVAKGATPSDALETAAKGVNQILSPYGIVAPAPAE
jgi:multiple sugar transport system substrate-binding protein